MPHYRRDHLCVRDSECVNIYDSEHSANMELAVWDVASINTTNGG